MKHLHLVAEITMLNYNLFVKESVSLTFSGIQRDQRVRLFFIIWPVATMKISPIMSQIRKSRLNIVPNEE